MRPLIHHFVLQCISIRSVFSLDRRRPVSVIFRKLTCYPLISIVLWSLIHFTTHSILFDQSTIYTTTRVAFYNRYWCRKLSILVNAFRNISKYCGPSSIVFCCLFRYLIHALHAQMYTHRLAVHQLYLAQLPLSSFAILTCHHCLLAFTLSYRAPFLGRPANTKQFSCFSTAFFLIKRSSWNACNCYEVRRQFLLQWLLMWIRRPP